MLDLASVTYVAIVGAIMCGVFGAALLLAPKRARAPAVSVRRGETKLDAVFSRRLGSSFAPKDAGERNSLRLWLQQAGFDSPQAIQTYFGIRIMLALGLATTAVWGLLIYQPPSSTALIGAGITAFSFGFLAPQYYVASCRRRIQRAVREGLPDMLDLLLVCSEAGLGLDMAMQKVGEEIAPTQPVLGGHLDYINAELRSGRSRADAMRAFAERTGIEETASFANLLIQSDTLGTSMVATLRIFAQDIRTRRLLKAEEIAQKVTAKLSMVLVAFFLPALLIAIGAPAVINAFRTLSAH
jgi:tight adherence protein C